MTNPEGMPPDVPEGAREAVAELLSTSESADATAADSAVANTDDHPVDAIDGLQDVPQSPISEDEAVYLAGGE